MTPEHKELLLKDLCARLPYGVKVRYSSYDRFITCTLHSINPIYNNVDLWSKNACFNPVSISKIKPYLFPLSSMTEEQKDEFDRLYTYDALIVEPQWKLIDFCNKHNIDYRGLIPMGLAIDATDKNIY
jgi:hypothetical protein